MFNFDLRMFFYNFRNKSPKVLQKMVWIDFRDRFKKDQPMDNLYLKQGKITMTIIECFLRTFL